MEKTIYSKEHRDLIAKLVAARKASGLRQEDVSRLIHKTQSFLSKLESGQKRIDVIELKQLAKIYKKNPGDFL